MELFGWRIQFVSCSYHLFILCGAIMKIASLSLFYLTRENFRAMIYYDLRRGLTQNNASINSFRLLRTKHHRKLLCVTGLVSLIVDGLRSRTNLKKAALNRLLYLI